MDCPANTSTLSHVCRSWLPPQDKAAVGLPLEERYNSLSWGGCRLLVGLENELHFCQWVISGVAGHPVLHRVLQLIVERAVRGLDRASTEMVHNHTGPGGGVKLHRHMSYVLAAQG